MSAESRRLKERLVLVTRQRERIIADPKAANYSPSAAVRKIEDCDREIERLEYSISIEQERK